MARPDSISAKTLRKHVDSGKENQNGYGYDDLIRMFNVPKYQKKGQPNFAAIGALFNKDRQTIKKWWLQYQLESNQEASNG